MTDDFDAATRYLGERLVFDFPELMQEDDLERIYEVIAQRCPDARLDTAQLNAIRERIRAKLQLVCGTTERTEIGRTRLAAETKLAAADMPSLSLAAGTSDVPTIVGAEGARFRLERRPTGETIVDVVGFTSPEQGVAKLFMVCSGEEQELVLTEPFDKHGSARVRTEDLADVESGAAQLILRIMMD